MPKTAARAAVFGGPRKLLRPPNNAEQNTKQAILPAIRRMEMHERRGEGAGRVRGV